MRTASPQQETHDPWTRIDGLADPWEMARLLEERAAHPHQGEVRRRVWDWLAVSGGTRLLEIGCGTGVWTREAAVLVGEAGLALGIDPSAFFIQEARRLARRGCASTTLAFQVADGSALPLLEGRWDLVLAATIFTHIQGQEAVMREMVRVARPGGRVAVFDQDWETFVLNHSERELTRRILNFFCDGRQNDGWAGRRVLGLMQQAGLEKVRILPLAWVDAQCGTYMRNRLKTCATFAVEHGRVSECEAGAWLEELDARAHDGSFFSSNTYFAFLGTR